MAHVVVKQLFKKYGELEVVHGIDFEIGDGEFVVLVGPSGCGKSTILRMIAGLETVTGGEIVINDRDRQRHAAARARHRHGVPGLCALSAHVRPPEPRLRPQDARRDARRHRRRRATTAEILQIEEPARAQAEGALRRPAPARRHRPRHRARAQGSSSSTSRSPISTPSSASRCARRSSGCTWRFNATSIYVTHDQTEAMTLADRIVVAEQRPHRAGRHARAISTTRPANLFVAGFIGSPTMNFLDARLERDGDGLSVVPDGGPSLKLPRPARRALRRARRQAGRPRPPAGASHQRLDRRGPRGGTSSRSTLTVEIAEPLGADTLIFSRIGGTEIIGRVSAVETPPLGSTMRLNAHLNHMHLFDPASGATL